MTTGDLASVAVIAIIGLIIDKGGARALGACPALGVFVPAGLFSEVDVRPALPDAFQ